MKINIPEKAAELILLAQNNLAKHLADGASSVLDHLDMTGMSTIVTSADAKHSLFLQKSRDAEKATENRDIALGTERGQRLTPGTVRFYAASIRDLLLGIYKGNERTLGDWSFEVNIDSSVVIPRNASQLIALAKGILVKHAADGAGSPLSSLNMADMQAKTNTADTQHTLSKTCEQAAEEASQDRDLVLGHGTNQNSYTPGTILFFVSSIRDVLLGTFRGRERALGEWGFGVTASTEVPAPPPAAASITLTTDQTTLQAINLKIAGNASATGAEQFKINFGDGNEVIGTLENGTLASYPHDYNIPGADASGIYTITITPVTADAFALMGVLQFDNCKLTGTVTIPATVQALGIQMPNNHITNFNIASASFGNLVSLVPFNNDMTESNVNTNLIGLDNNGLSGGFANFGGGTNAPPTGAGITAKNNLIAKGWTVLTN